MNENIFREINTKEKAYWLGFLYSDGNISKKGNRIGFCLSIKDKQILEKFCLFVGVCPSNIISYKNPKVIYLYVYSKIMKNDLIDNGIVPNKTKVNIFPKIESLELFLAFMLGVYDGDGTESACLLSSGNKEFLEYCCDRLQIPNDKIFISINPNGQCYKLHLGVNIFKQMLFNYQNSLERKRLTGIYYPGSDYIPLDINPDYFVERLKSSTIKELSNELDIKYEILRYHIINECNINPSHF